MPDDRARLAGLAALIEPLTTVGPDPLLDEAAAKLELTEHLRDLDEYGFTVVPPEKVGSADFLDDLANAVRALHHRRSREEQEQPSLTAAAQAGAGEVMTHALFEDPIFEQALMNPVAQTLARAMTGHTCRLSLFDAVVKPRGGGALGFHCDTEMTEPYPPTPQFCNVTYALSEYSSAAGSTVFVPGSHRLLRQPHSGEVNGDFNTSSVAGSARMPTPVEINCPAGSIIAWSGLTWHGATPRTVKGQRVSILMYFCRWYMQPQENYRDHLAEGALERNAARFAQLLDVVPGWALKDARRWPDPAQMLSGRVTYPIIDAARP